MIVCQRGHSVTKYPSLIVEATQPNLLLFHRIELLTFRTITAVSTLIFSYVSLVHQVECSVVVLARESVYHRLFQTFRLRRFVLICEAYSK